MNAGTPLMHSRCTLIATGALWLSLTAATAADHLHAVPPRDAAGGQMAISWLAEPTTAVALRAIAAWVRHRRKLQHGREDNEKPPAIPQSPQHFLQRKHSRRWLPLQQLRFTFSKKTMASSLGTPRPSEAALKVDADAEREAALLGALELDREAGERGPVVRFARLQARLRGFARRRHLTRAKVLGERQTAAVQILSRWLRLLLLFSSARWARRVRARCRAAEAAASGLAPTGGTARAAAFAAIASLLPAPPATGLERPPSAAPELPAALQSEQAGVQTAATETERADERAESAAAEGAVGESTIATEPSAEAVAAAAAGAVGEGGEPDGWSASTQAMVDALAEYCGLTGVDAMVKRSAGKLLSTLGAGRAARRVPPTMKRGYAEMQGRSLRIFLSSTFRDMNGERAIFTKRYAASLRQASPFRLSPSSATLLVLPSPSLPCSPSPLTVL